MSRSEPDSDIARARVTIAGRVQGVYYRASAEREARAAGLSGWVRNGHDGSVEAEFEGPRAEVDAMIAWCRVGPARALVTDVDVEWLTPTGERGFGVRY